MSVQKNIGSRETRLPVLHTGPFVLRSLLEDVPLSAEGERDDIEINCVEFLGEDSHCVAMRSSRDVCLFTPSSVLVLISGRPKSLHWNLCLGDPTFCTNTPRTCRPYREAFIYPRLKAAASVYEPPYFGETWDTTDLTASAGQ